MANKLRQKSTTRQELLDNTVNFFNMSNRSVENINSCMYRSANNECACAIGREISDSLANKLDSGPYQGVNKDEVFAQLPARLRMLGQEFLCDIQNLHDAEIYWIDSGISKFGKDAVNNICVKYALTYRLTGMKCPAY